MFGPKNLKKRKKSNKILKWKRIRSILLGLKKRNNAVLASKLKSKSNLSRSPLEIHLMTWRIKKKWG